MTINWRATRETITTTLAGVLIATSGAFLTAHTAAADSDGPGVKGEICYEKLPDEAHKTFRDIWSDGPYDYPEKDGTVFHNREDQLPQQEDRDYYHEFTVETPDLDHRGAKRIVTGGKEADKKDDYYTEDHYETFNLVDHDC